ncbi:MAG: prepilin-type N-terminal cleavage/methylation domain-containing protein [Burkholderiales bacterium]|nr:MAG: prepilin-type N-terminal cleavage/methylation domain-containing protein [Burkholderiales bacterium]
MRVRGAAIRRASGFTLMELMITVVILAILASIAIPSYVAYVERGKRAAARSALLAAASFLERNFTTNGCYNYVTVADCQAQSGTALTLPGALAPAEGRASYILTVGYAGSTTGQAFTLTATPCGSAGTCPAGSDPFTDGKCGALTLTQAGVRGRSGSEDLSVCWQR